MSFEQYPEYRDCDRGWVSRLPKNWKLTQLRHIAHIYAGGTPDRSNPDFWTNGTVPWLNSGAVNNWCITSPSEWITDLAASGGHTRWVPPKSVVIALAGQGKTKGMAARLEFRSTCNQSMAAIVPSNLLEYRFLQFWITANYENVRNLAGGDLRDGLNLQHIGGIYVPLPSVGEQEAIANFLDHETAEIDAFIADQERLIGLLEERRVATITQAVTKGLDSNAHMKDTDMEWLGRVPDHWEMSSLRHLLKSPLKYGANEPATSADPEQVRYLRITDFDQRGQLREETFRSLPEEIARNYMVLPNDVLLARSGATVGKAFIVPEDSPPACFAGYLIRVDVSREKILPEYFFLYTQTASFEAWKNLVMIQATIQNISAEKYASLKVPLPPLDEQRHIVQDLSKEISKIDTAIADAREAIALSEERRAALISAAVTGQLDVTQTQTPGSVGQVLEQGVRV